MPESFRDSKRERYLSTIFDAIDDLEVNGLIDKNTASALMVQQNTLSNDQLRRISLYINEYGADSLLELVNKIDTRIKPVFKHSVK